MISQQRLKTEQNTKVGVKKVKLKRKCMENCSSSMSHFKVGPKRTQSSQTPILKCQNFIAEISMSACMLCFISVSLNQLFVLTAHLRSLCSMFGEFNQSFLSYVALVNSITISEINPECVDAACQHLYTIISIKYGLF